MSFLIVGLGNPGPRYAFTRHNIGFMVADALAAEWNCEFKQEHKSLVAKSSTPPVFVAKPQTFMNLSGEAVQALMAYYKIPLDNVLVVHDEVDLPFGKLKFQKGRGHGGHNGIRNIHEHIGPNYARLRAGVGRPSIPQMEVSDYVLQNFDKSEIPKLQETVGLAAEACIRFIEDGFTKAQNEYNTTVEG